MSEDRDPARRAEARERLARSGVEVLHEDNHVLAVAKPAGLLSQAGPQDAVALPEILEAYRREAEGKAGRAYVGLVHRLDRNVSGVLVVAKTSKAASRLARAFRTRDPRLAKVYLAWVAGRPEARAGEIATPLARSGGITRPAEGDEEGAREGRLSWALEGTGRGAARLRIDLGTGLPHQIRAQLSAAGHPLVGDRKYGGPDGPRPALHALRLVVPHPVLGTPLDLVAAVPGDLRDLDRALRVAPPLDAWSGAGRR